LGFGGDDGDGIAFDDAKWCFAAGEWRSVVKELAVKVS